MTTGDSHPCYSIKTISLFVNGETRSIRLLLGSAHPIEYEIIKSQIFSRFITCFCRSLSMTNERSEVAPVLIQLGQFHRHPQMNAQAEKTIELGYLRGKIHAKIIEYQTVKLRGTSALIKNQSRSIGQTANHLECNTKTLQMGPTSSIYTPPPTLQKDGFNWNPEKC